MDDDEAPSEICWFRWNMALFQCGQCGWTWGAAMHCSIATMRHGWPGCWLGLSGGSVACGKEESRETRRRRRKKKIENVGERRSGPYKFWANLDTCFLIICRHGLWKWILGISNLIFLYEWLAASNESHPKSQIYMHMVTVILHKRVINCNILDEDLSLYHLIKDRGWQYY